LADSDYQWIVNQGVMFAILVFLGFIAWRALLGHEKTGKKGLLEKWADASLSRLNNHIAEQTEFGERAAQRGQLQDDALRVLVDSQAPPGGSAYVAAKAVYETAENVEQLRAACHQATKICRLMARQYPQIEAAIVSHCEEIERLVKQA